MVAGAARAWVTGVAAAAAAARAPWWRSDRRNQVADTAMATPVSSGVATVLATRYVDSGWLNSSHIVIAALAKWTKAHRSEMRVKNRRTHSRDSRLSGSGQKSAARRPASGRPAGTDSRKAPATATVASVGWRK